MKVNIKSMSISTILTIIFIVFMTIYSELNKVFKDFLKNLAGHHWVAKGIIAVIFFILVYFILKNFINDNKKVKETVVWVIIAVILGSLAIFGFYVYEFFISIN